MVFGAAELENSSNLGLKKLPVIIKNENNALFRVRRSLEGQPERNRL